MAQGTLRGLIQAFSRITHVYQETRRTINNPLHRQADVNDVLILGEHQCLMAVRLNLGDIDNIDPVDEWWIPV